MPMTGFFCQDKYLEQTKNLTDEELGRLFRACMRYHKDGVEPELDGRESMAFDFIRDDIDNAEQAYTKKCDQNKRNRTGGNERPITTDNDRQRQSTNNDDRDQYNINKKNGYIKNNNKGNITPLFERFWAAYPRHEGKQAAMKAFEKAKVDEQLLGVILTAIAKQKQSAQWQEDGGKFIPHPATWINGRRWEDETAQYTGVKLVAAQDYNQRDYSATQEEAIQRFVRMAGGQT